MIQSMTGFGRSTAGKRGDKVNANIKAVNGRFLDIKIRGIDIDPSSEKKIRDIVSDRLIRGTVHISLELEGGGKSQSLSFNKERFEAIEGILLNIQKEYGRHLEMGDLVNVNDLFTHVDGELLSEDQLIDAVNKACSQVIEMRESEGQKLKSDFELRLSKLNDVLGFVEKELPKEFHKR